MMADVLTDGRDVEQTWYCHRNPERYPEGLVDDNAPPELIREGKSRYLLNDE